MKCLIVGDLHLGRSLSIGKPPENGNLNSRLQDQVDLLNFIIQYCITNNVSNIFLTGDVYHDYRPYPTIICIFMKWIYQCESNNINVHMINGNHEIIRSGQYVISALDLISELNLKSKLYKEMTRIELDDFTIVVIPFKDKRMYDVKDTDLALQMFADELNIVTKQSSDKVKIAIGHMAIEGSLSIGDEISDHLNELYIPPEMFKWFDYVWMGHIHHPQVIQEKNPYCAHVGSLDRSDFSKTEIENNKIMILISSDTSHQEVVLPIRSLKNIEIEVPSEKDSTDFVINKLCLIDKKETLKDSTIRLNIGLSFGVDNIDRDKVTSYLNDNLEVHHICNLSETRMISTIQISPEDSFDNTMKVSDAINKWAETRFLDEDECKEFKTLAHEIRQAYEEKFSHEIT